MQLLEDVFAGYPQTVASGEEASSRRSTPDVASILVGLPAMFQDHIAKAGYDPADFKVYGGIGQVPFNWAKIPWVAICRRSVTITTTKGYYIVLLFREDMSGCYLSLNQGFTQYKEAYGGQKIAQKQSARCAVACASFLAAKPPFISGAIELAATLDMGRGYERGAIVSRYFPRFPAADEADFKSGLTALLGMYDQLIGRVGSDILSFLPPVGEQVFQAEAGAMAEAETLPDLATGPLPLPTALNGGLFGRFKRDPRMAARALKAADFRCEVNPLHETFVARRNGRRFVEAHHLFPMSVQPQFQHSLDVPENIVALCPNCHRLLHHGAGRFTKPILNQLWDARQAKLEGRGIAAPFKQLVTAYREALEEDD